MQTAASNTILLSVFPVELLCHIFLFLPVDLYLLCSRICKNWAFGIKQAIRFNKRRANKLVRKGLESMENTNVPTDSLKMFEKAISIYPRYITAYFWKAKTLFILHKEMVAMNCLHDALSRNPSPVDRLKLEACLLYAANDDSKASTLLENALQMKPYDPSIHFELGFCYHGLQQFSRAIEFYSSALALSYHRTFVVLANRANCYYRSGRISDAFNDLERSLNISPHYELALRTRAIVHLHVGNSDAAYNDYTNIILSSIEPKMISEAYFNRAFIYGTIDESDIENARVVDPTNPEPVRYRATILANSAHVEDAIGELNTWVTTNPHHKDLPSQLSFRAELFALEEKWPLALRDYEEAIHILTGNSPWAITHSSSTLVNDTLNAYRSRLRQIQNEMTDT